MSIDPHYDTQKQIPDRFVDKYNFSRRVLDHRIHHDFNYSLNNS
jgi:hypothetical protein